MVQRAKGRSMAGKAKDVRLRRREGEKVEKKEGEKLRRWKKRR
ncbi:hypothetical protein D1AOALGA4SA_8473 [Olavius algarvensis Delta 1 endosymbiont]|nr:hypothetical protein D1AOALGA4SA_8473 [Olavius algarvensis Delta 1 endosymbiont]